MFNFKDTCIQLDCYNKGFNFLVYDVENAGHFRSILAVLEHGKERAKKKSIDGVVELKTILFQLMPLIKASF